MSLIETYFNQLLSLLFVNSGYELLIIALIVAIAGVVRGCIGFGFSALVVASTSLWIDVKYTAVMVIFMEVVASLFMLNNVKSEIDYKLLKLITIGGVFASFVGVWMLATLQTNLHQILVSVYLLVVALLALFKFEFKTAVTNIRLTITGIIAGFYNGLAGVGGIFIASMLTSSNYPIKNIRATLVVYFFMIEAAFFIASYYNNLVTKEVVITSFILCIPMLFGIIYGSKLFASLPEKKLKQMVLLALLVLSIAGLIKSVL